MDVQNSISHILNVIAHPDGKAVIGIASIALIAVFMIGSPVQNLPADKSRNNVMVILPINELNIRDTGLSTITLGWSPSSGNMKMATYKIYMGNDLTDIVDGSVFSYKVTNLRAGALYQFHVDACDASDKCSTGGPAVAARTSTLQEAAEIIIDKVEKLTSGGVLDKTRGESLIKSLSGVYLQETENPENIINNIQVFIKDVNVLIDNGVLSPEMGQSLIDPAQEIIRNVT